MILINFCSENAEKFFPLGSDADAFLAVVQRMGQKKLSKRGSQLFDR